MGTLMQPIVQQNPMAMNESVAATCCYRSVFTGVSFFEQVLHGGYVGDATTVLKEKSEYYPDNKVWLSLTGDYPLEYTGCELRYVGGVPNVFIPAADEDDVDELLPVSSIKTYLEGGASCKHDDTSCAYYSWPYVNIPTAHINATTKHALAGVDWSAPHKAMQFSS